jgi:Predicted metal-dependent hydrolase
MQPFHLLHMTKSYFYTQLLLLLLIVLLFDQNSVSAGKAMNNYFTRLAFATSRFSGKKIVSSTTIGTLQLPSRLFGSKRGTPGSPPGSIDIYNEQNTLSSLDIDKIKLTISEIRDIIGYPTYDVSLILTDDEEMQQTNYETRGVNRPTDILSFQFQDLVDEPGILAEPDFDIPEYYNLGDMMIDVPYVMRRCEEDREFNEGVEGEDDVEHEVEEDEDYVGDDDRGVSGVMSTIYDPEQRIQLLLVHGMLHLVGYDHIEDADYELMVLKEEQVIKELQKRLNADWCDIE